MFIESIGWVRRMTLLWQRYDNNKTVQCVSTLMLFDSIRKSNVICRLQIFCVVVEFDWALSKLKWTGCYDGIIWTHTTKIFLLPSLTLPLARLIFFGYFHGLICLILIQFEKCLRVLGYAEFGFDENSGMNVLWSGALRSDFHWIHHIAHNKKQWFTWTNLSRII